MKREQINGYASNRDWLELTKDLDIRGYSTVDPYAKHNKTPEERKIIELFEENRRKLTCSGNETKKQ